MACPRVFSSHHSLLGPSSFRKQSPLSPVKTGPRSLSCAHAPSARLHKERSTMETRPTVITALACVAAGLTTALLTAAAMSGPLDPPAGPVAPTYKTLTEVEPRTPISSTTTPGDATTLFR